MDQLAPSGVTLETATPPVWPPHTVDRRWRYPKIGRLGEAIAVEWLRTYGGEPDAQRVNTAVDILSRRLAVEVKAGLVTNRRQAQHWRLTFSDAKGGERAILSRLSQFERSRYFARKQAAILRRKQQLMTSLGLTPRTLTMIINPESMQADLFVFDRFADRIGWNSQETARAYRGTFKVTRCGDLIPGPERAP